MDHDQVHMQRRNRSGKAGRLRPWGSVIMSGFAGLLDGRLDPSIALRSQKGVLRRASCK
jgi:hypothetical protein